MELLLKQCTLPGNVLFLAEEPCGRLLYRLWGNPHSLGGVFVLMDDNGQ